MHELDETCLDTPAALLLDGANGACGEARLGAGTGHVAHVALVLVVAIGIAAWLVTRRVSSAARRAGVVAIALIGAMPGAYALLALRGDRPTSVRDTARASTALHDRMRAFALRHGCAHVEDDACDECLPAVRLALAGLRCDAPATIVLRAGALDARCEEQGDRLVCGPSR
ncbi:hypothetical protein [Sandaracinus amylolyticus]|uniref:Uncharacterized protein n=1 Tax=Sandaracinus amylolyticus TaxID=927083 RepID=A0A0F6SE70_9BACT|nr:hypothetical protein [Sandaracinus amylolyticus]AKF04679.1 hypothetical protein DB32_001828 [Sandaracinus amylolyticus]